MRKACLVRVPGPGTRGAGPALLVLATLALGNVAVGQAAPLECKAGPLPPSPVRRLTRAEFDYTVEDLLGDTRRLGQRLLPVDETSAGYKANAVATLKIADLEKYALVARELAAEAVRNIDHLLACPGNRRDAACVTKFIGDFGKRAFRRPLATSEVGRYRRLHAQVAARGGSVVAIQRVLEAILQSPHFLYRSEVGVPTDRPGVRQLTGFEMASRLSYFLWSSPPDAELFAAAERGELGDAAGVERHARRMIRDPRFRRTLRHLSLQWMGIDRRNLDKNSATYRDFTSETWRSAQEELVRFMEYLVIDTDGDLRTLLTAPFSFVDQHLAPIYGVQTGGAFERIAFEPGQRSGVLTQIGVLSALATPTEASPIARGKFVRERLLCQPVQPPPPDEEIEPPPIDKTLTLRERLQTLHQLSICRKCHAFIDPPGFAFEHFDGIGRYRTRHQHPDKPVDASGLLTKTDVDGPMASVTDLAERLARSEMVARCVPTQWLRFALGRSETEADDCALDEVARRFAGSGQRLSESFVLVAASDSMRFTGVEAAPTIARAP